MSKKRRKSVIQKVGGGIGYCHCEGSMGEGTRTSGILRIKYALDTHSDGGGSVLMGKTLRTLGRIVCLDTKLNSLLHR